LSEIVRTKSTYDKIVQDDNTKSEFQPNIKLLYRIAKAIIENNSLGKTALSQKANINYVILMKHLAWLDEKGLIESIINDGKVHIKFGEKGRQFADQLTKLIDGELNFIDR
jgi:predicted transcriptional regulator